MSKPIEETVKTLQVMVGNYYYDTHYLWHIVKVTEVNMRKFGPTIIVKYHPGEPIQPWSQFLVGHFNVRFKRVPEIMEILLRIGDHHEI